MVNNYLIICYFAVPVLIKAQNIKTKKIIQEEMTSSDSVRSLTGTNLKDERRLLKQNGSYIFSASQYKQIVQVAMDVDKKVYTYNLW